MLPPSRPPSFDPKEWSQFDFTRWHLDGLPLKDASAAIADLAQRLFNSPEWRESFQGILPTVQTGVVDLFKGRSGDLQAEAAELSTTFQERTADLRAQIAAQQEAIRRADAPPTLQASPDAFQAAIRVETKGTHLGLPGLVVRLLDPRAKDTALVESVTDLDGNAVGSVSGPIIEELARQGGELTLEILSPQGKSLRVLEQGLCPRPNQTESKVVVLPASPELEPHRAVAQQIRTQREERLKSLFANLDRLGQDQEALQDGLRRKLEDIQNVISELGKDIPQAKASSRKNTK